MPWPMQRRSSSSVAATYLDKDQRVLELTLAARRLAERLPAVRRVLLFGSLVAGIPTPRSDADLVVELSHSPHPNPRDRLPEVLRALRPLPCPVDLFVYTTQEIEQYGNVEAVLRLALCQGKDLL